MSTEPSRFIGRIAGLYADVLQGWALCTEVPDLRVVLEVYVDGAHVNTARADQFQPQPEQGDGFHGFAVQLRPAWLEGARSIAVRVANQGPWLQGTLQLPGSERPAEPGPATSQVWYGGGLKVGGWAWDAAEPARHMTVTAREGGRVLARVTADELHPALVYRPSADHGFAIDLPWELADGQPHEIHIETDLGEPVAGSPVRVLAVPQGLAGLLRAHWPRAGDDDPAFALALRVAQEQERLAPQSAGFAHYPQWFALFQQPDPQDRARAAGLRAGVLLFGEGDEAASRASIEAQTHAAHATHAVVAERDAPSLARPGIHAAPDAASAGATFTTALRALLATGADFIVPLHAGDRLVPHALAALLAPFADEADRPAWAFADCDCDGPAGERTDPWLKPSWDIDLFLGADIVTPGAVWSAAAVREALALLESPDAPPAPGLHAFTAALAAATEANRWRVARITRVLYHRRHAAPHSPADAPRDEAREAAIAWLAQRLRPGARVEPNPLYPGLLRVHWPLPEPLPRVSLIVPTRDRADLLRACMQGLLDGTDYGNLELIVVDNDSCEPETQALFEALKARGVKVLAYPHPFNYSAINNFAVEHATGEIVGLVNNDVEVIEPGWLKAMVAELSRPGVGIVGAKLLWPNGMVQHGGVVLGINGLAAHTGNRWHRDDAGYLGFNQLTRRQGAVTAACLLVRRADFLAIGGLDAVRFGVAFNDVDLCLRMRQRGGTILVEPAAGLVHRESASRGKDRESQQAARAQREQLHLLTGLRRGSDPWYHPDLNADWARGPFGGLDLAP